MSRRSERRRLYASCRLLLLVTVASLPVVGLASGAGTANWPTGLPALAGRRANLLLCCSLAFALGLSPVYPFPFHLILSCVATSNVHCTSPWQSSQSVVRLRSNQIADEYVYERQRKCIACSGAFCLAKALSSSSLRGLTSDKEDLAIWMHLYRRGADS